MAKCAKHLKVITDADVGVDVKIFLTRRKRERETFRGHLSSMASGPQIVFLSRCKLRKLD